MKPQNVIFSLCLLLATLAIVVSRIWHEPQTREAFDRHPKQLYYTPQATCLMQCLAISNNDVDDIRQNGIINFSKSDRNHSPCAIYALQGQTRQGKKLSVVFTQCKDETRVMACYPLQNNKACPCPNDF